MCQSVIQSSRDILPPTELARLFVLKKTSCLLQVVIVSRWYGGILLGPDRFKHINNAARSLLGSCGYIAGVNSNATTNQKTLPKSNLQKGKFVHSMFLLDFERFLSLL